MTYLVFPAGPTDAADLARVHVAAWRETYPGMLPPAYLAGMSEPAHERRWDRNLAYPGADEIILAAGDARGLVGYAAAGPSRRKLAGEGEIYTLYLLKRAQGHGLGRRLLSDTARALHAHGATSLLISVLKENHAARAFYEHLGGAPDAPRAERGPGGGQVFEVAYLWPDIRTVLATAR